MTIATQFSASLLQWPSLCHCRGEKQMATWEHSK